MRRIRFCTSLLLTFLGSICGFLQVSAQKVPQHFPTDAQLRQLVDKHIHTPVKRMMQSNGDLYLHRNFSAYLHAMPRYAGPEPAGAEDLGHKHDNDALEKFLNRPHPSVATMEKYFAEAARDFDVPVPLLRAYAQVQSNWAQVSESMYGSWGIMGLIESGNTKQISQAAALLGVNADSIQNNAKMNIRAAAALLNQYQQGRAKAITLEDWFESVRALTGLTDGAMQTSLAKRVFQTLQQGSKTISIWGEVIWLEPNESLAIPESSDALKTASNIQPLGNGTPDYSGAIYNLTTCNYNSRPPGAGINYYFVHYIATGTYEGTISWFKNCDAQASAHYVVRNFDGQVTQMVDEANRAWTQGVSEYNDQGIGVEHEVLATNLSMWDNVNMLREAGKLCADVCNRREIPKSRRVSNGDKGIYGHSDVRSTDCPNMTQARWDNFLANVQGALPSVGTPTLYSISATSGSSQVTATWKSNTEPSLLGYRLYYATDDALTSWRLAANEITLTAGTTSITLQPSQFVVVPTEPVYHFRLTAVVPNGIAPLVESGPSDVYSRSWLTTGPRALIVDGFDRTGGSYKSNAHPFAASYMKAMRDRGVLEISTVANEKVEDGTFSLSGYDIVVWFVGDESSANVVFSAAEKSAIINYLHGGGKLLVSGSEIAYNIGRSAAAAYDLSFMNNYLKSNYVNDGSVSYTPATGITATGFDDLNIPFGWVYPEDYPDAISPAGGASAIMNYAVAPNQGGIAYSGTFGIGTKPGALIYLGFPLETASDLNLSLFMAKALPYFGIAPIPAPPIAANDAAIARSGRAKRINALTNDNGNGSSFNTSSLLISTPPAYGTATAHADGTITYVSNDGHTGADAFSYKVASNTGLYSNEASVNITVQNTESCSATPPEVDDDYPLRDLRGAWVSTVSNIDWPSSRTLTPAQQQAELLRILDTLRNTGINTVFLQVRPECDALYASPYEPWSYWLTNAQGTAPSPAWDPLQFAIDAAHTRGMDLHAWLNPYRAKQSTPALAPNHVAVLHPEWTFISGALTMLNPGRPEVRSYLTQIIADIATRYDVDGIHFDDYFYPYAGMSGQDADTYLNYNPTQIATIEDWRRNNVNELIGMVYDTLQKIKSALNRNIVFGVSPFGIWKSGVPSGISGTSSYSQLYCDPIAWLQAGKVDYLAPQLYWKISGGQDYEKLSAWWNDQGKQYGRHIYQGLALYKMVDSNDWPATEIQNQINLNRDGLRTEVLGQIFFSTKQIMANNKGLKTALQGGQYRHKSYAPAMAWKDAVCPNAPSKVWLDYDTLRWDTPVPASDGDTAAKYVVYKYLNEGEISALANDGTKVTEITGINKLYLPNAGFARYVVTALDKNNNESMGTLSSMPDVVLCPNGSILLHGMVSGNNFQWQIYQNENWQTLSNPAYFSGTTSAQLSITNLPVSFYGTRFRCLANGNTSGPVYTIKFGTTWTGVLDGLWNNAANWNCGIIPFKDIDAIVPAGVPHAPTVNVANAAARSVVLRHGASVLVAAGNSLTISQE